MREVVGCKCLTDARHQDVLVPCEPRFAEALDSLLERCGTTLSPSRFILKVSNAYHAVESTDYDLRHTEITREELPRLKSQSEAFLGSRSHRRLRVLDIGCGTGIAASVLLSTSSNPAEDFETIICMDPSWTMIQASSSRLKGKPCTKFVQGVIDAVSCEPSRRFDAILTCSVLHHIPDVLAFGQEMAARLRPGGVWLMCHEPLRIESRIVAGTARRYEQLRSKSHSLRRRIRLRINRLRGKEASPSSPHILDRVADALSARGVTPLHRLTRGEVRGLVDIHTPNPQPGEFTIGYDGFDLAHLSSAYSRYGLFLDSVEIYDRLKAMGRLGPPGWVLERLLSVMFPNVGHHFSAIWRRQDDER